jgi:putative DNA primase/helicase
VFELLRNFLRVVSDDLDPRSREAFGKLAFAERVERGARSDAPLAATSTDWDVNDFLLATPHGTVDLKSGLLRPTNAAERGQSALPPGATAIDFVSMSSASTR